MNCGLKCLIASAPEWVRQGGIGFSIGYALWVAYRLGIAVQRRRLLGRRLPFSDRFLR